MTGSSVEQERDILLPLAHKFLEQLDALDAWSHQQLAGIFDLPPAQIAAARVVVKHLKDAAMTYDFDPGVIPGPEPFLGPTLTMAGDQLIAAMFTSEGGEQIVWGIDDNLDAAGNWKTLP